MKKTIDFIELKRIEANLLNVFADYCEDHSLSYYLAYGTLIGAIRHNGFIPWDDDIDVIMPRNDYDRLVNSFNTEMAAKSVKVVSHKLDQDYYLPFAKLIDTNTVLKEKTDIKYDIGVYIDIFPLENLADDYEAAKKRLKHGFNYNRMLMLKTISIDPKRKKYKNLILKLGKFALRKKSINHILEEMDKYCCETKSEELSPYVGVISGISAGDESRVFDRKWFESAIEVEFGGKLYKAPTGYDLLLKQLYGDYMQLPPKEEQITHHAFEAWYK